jgi:outer membrane protein TolC
MKAHNRALACALLISGPFLAQDLSAPDSRKLTLTEAVQLALAHNHAVRLAALQVQEKQHAKDVAKSSYYPILHNETNVFHVTDTQFIDVPAGSLGGAASAPIPAKTLVIEQGGATFAASGTSLTQPLTGYLKFKPQNDMAMADLNGARAKSQKVENDVALKVHQIYYKLLIAQVHRSATQARIQAADALRAERVEQVKYGSLLEEELIDSRAQYLEAKQDLLSTELQLSDLTMQLNDVMGLPLVTSLALDPSAPVVERACPLEECVHAALEAHPEIAEARQEMERASAGVRLAKAEYIPEVSAFVRYSFQRNIPFLADNFGAFGVRLGYEIFDGGRRRATLRERETQLAQAKENLARITDEVSLRVQTAYNKLTRTQQMVGVSEELLALRTESSRVTTQQLQKGTALKSQVESAVAHELDAKTLLLQSQLDYVQAYDEMINALGRKP